MTEVITVDDSLFQAQIQELIPRFKGGVALAINAACEEAIDSVAIPKAAHDTGYTKGHIHLDLPATAESLIAEIKADTGYAEALEEGSTPHWPPVDPLIGWASRHATTGTYQGDRSAGFLIARAISRRGTRAQPFMTPMAEALPALILAQVEIFGEMALASVAGGGSV